RRACGNTGRCCRPRATARSASPAWPERSAPARRARAAALRPAPVFLSCASSSVGVSPVLSADYSCRPRRIRGLLDPNRSDLTAGVAGTGTMGRGIAQVLAQSGARTLVFDAQPGAARKAKDTIAQALGKLVEKGRVGAAEADQAVSHIEIADSLEALAPCHVVVEAIVEDLAAKKS